MLSLFSTRTEHNVLALIYKHFSRGEVEVREPESPPCHVCQKERKEKKPSHDDSLLKCFFFFFIVLKGQRKTKDRRTSISNFTKK